MAAYFCKKKLARPNKLERYAQNAASENVLEPEKELFQSIAGKWKSEFFNNSNPLVLELACGKGEYTIGLAEKFPDKNFVGIDLKGDRIWVGSQKAQESDLRNVAFIRSRIELLPKLFNPQEVDEIWLTFPDPRPKDRDEKHRLTNMYFMNLYRNILNSDGWFRFKTDNTELFDYTLEVLSDVPVRNQESTHDLYKSPLLDEHHGLQTKYEKIWTAKGETIKYLKLKFE